MTRQYSLFLFFYFYLIPRTATTATSTTNYCALSKVNTNSANLPTVQFEFECQSFLCFSDSRRKGLHGFNLNIYIYIFPSLSPGDFWQTFFIISLKQNMVPLLNVSSQKSQKLLFSRKYCKVTKERARMVLIEPSWLCKDILKVLGSLNEKPGFSIYGKKGNSYCDRVIKPVFAL